MLNATSLAKPNAKEHLSADIQNFQCDMILIVETWFNHKHNSADFAIDGYSLYRRDRHGKRKGGGLCLYARNEFKCSILNVDSESQSDNNIEVLWILCNTDCCSFIVCLCYHPPNPLYKCSQIIDHISNGIDYFTSLYTTDFILVAGDFNSLNTDFISVDLGFYQLVKEFTHMNHIIDKVFINRPGIYNRCYTVRSIVKTKHRAIIFTTQNDANNGAQPKTKSKCSVYDTRPHNIDRLRYFLGTYNWSTLYDCLTIDDIYTAFINVLNVAINTCIPSKTVTMRSTDPYYITPYIKSLLVKRNKLRRKGRTMEADELAVKINDLIRQVQITRLNKLSASNTAELWKFVRPKNSKQSTAAPSSSSLLSSPDEVNAFSAKISTDENYNIADVLAANNATTSIDGDINDPIEPLQPYFIENLLHKLKHTSPGFDGIPAWLFNSCSYEIAEIVTFLINKSLMLGIVPNNWRTAIVTPIQKNPCPQSLSDFRPISVTPILSRLTEKLIVSKWLRPALSASSIQDQFAFKQTGSTTCALIKLVDTITLSFEDGNNYVSGLMVDFSKAFDTVDHAILVSKLNGLGLPPCIRQWIVSFLLNRSQIVKLNGQYSSSVPINRGIVQGSAIGPYLFVLMISDLKPLGKDNTYVKYADDLTVVVPEHSQVTVEQERHHIFLWAAKNKLIINLKKTYETCYVKHQRYLDQLLIFKSDIDVTNDHKLLGVYIDSKLNFRAHIDHLITVCSQRFYILKLLRNQGLPISALHIVYNSIIVNKILYCLSVWGGYVRETDVDRFNALFRRARKYSYTDTVYDFKGLLYNSDRKLFAKLQSPLHCLNHILPPVKSTTALSLRNRGHDFNLPLSTIDIRKHSFMPRALYNFV